MKYYQLRTPCCKKVSTRLPGEATLEGEASSLCGVTRCPIEQDVRGAAVNSADVPW
jgi:hypothetical protein